MENPQLTQLVRIIKIIGGALIMGVVIFAIVTFLIADWGKANAEFSPIGLAGLAFAVAACAASFYVPGVIFKQAAQQFAAANPKPEVQSLLQASGQAVTTSTIVRLALNEGGAFMALLVWMISGNIFGLVGAFFCLAAMILKFPTSERVEQQFADFRQELKQQQRGT